MSPDIKQHQLRCFVAVAEAGSIRHAAPRLGRSSGAVSMTLRQLDELLEKPLFEPGGKSVLTPMGRYLLGIAKEEIERHDQAIRSVLAVARNELGDIRIAAVPSFASRYLPGLIGQYAGEFPHVSITIFDDNACNIRRRVENGGIDFGIASLAGDADTVGFAPLIEDPLGVVCSRDHELASLDRPLDWPDLASHPFIANGTCALIDDPAFAPILGSARFVVQNTISLLALVASGIGVTTLPGLAVPDGNEGIVFRPLPDPGTRRCIGIVSPVDRTLSPAAEAFRSAVTGAFADAGPDAAPGG